MCSTDKTRLTFSLIQDIHISSLDTLIVEATGFSIHPGYFRLGWNVLYCSIHGKLFKNKPTFKSLLESPCQSVFVLCFTYLTAYMFVVIHLVWKKTALQPLNVCIDIQFKKIIFLFLLQLV